MAKTHLGAVRSQAPQGSAELTLLREGKMSLDEYIESRISRAIAAIPSKLDDERKATIRELLRVQLLTDPLLQSYLETASGIPRDPALRDS